jgi:hypothetical protein
MRPAFLLAAAFVALAAGRVRAIWNARSICAATSSGAASFNRSAKSRA